MLELGWINLSLLIAIRAFEAPEAAKSLLASAGFVGLLLTPFSLSLLSRWRGSPTLAVALLAAISGGLLLAASRTTALGWFVAAIFAARLLWVQGTPLMTHTFAHNYRPSERGTRFATAVVLNAAGGVLLAVVGGQWLEADIGRFPLLLIFLAACALGNAIIVGRPPAPPPLQRPPRNPLAHLNLLWRDRLFGWMLLSWMLIGVGNLITVPLRVEYLAAPEYGLQLGNQAVLLLTFAVPVGVRILASRWWGRLFDHLNFVWWRIAVNSCFIASFLVFYSSHGWFGLTLGMLLLGLAMAGGTIGWQLWVTKLAPPDQVSAYMSVHTFLTGLRGSFAPWIGYALLSQWGPFGVACFSTGLVTLASVMMLTVLRHPRWALVTDDP